MSLGQRLQKQPEKGSGELNAQDYEASIRRLKLLSKSQTALLKVIYNIPNKLFSSILTLFE